MSKESAVIYRTKEHLMQYSPLSFSTSNLSLTFSTFSIPEKRFSIASLISEKRFLLDIDIQLAVSSENKFSRLFDHSRRKREVTNSPYPLIEIKLLNILSENLNN